MICFIIFALLLWLAVALFLSHILCCKLLVNRFSSCFSLSLYQLMYITLRVSFSFLHPLLFLFSFICISRSSLSCVCSRCSKINKCVSCCVCSTVLFAVGTTLSFVVCVYLFLGNSQFLGHLIDCACCWLCGPIS